MQPLILMVKQVLLEALQVHTKQLFNECLEFESGPLCGPFFLPSYFFRVTLAMIQCLGLQPC